MARADWMLSGSYLLRGCREGARVRSGDLDRLGGVEVEGLRPAAHYVKAFLPAADAIVDPLPWQLDDSEVQRKRSRGRVLTLAHQVAGLSAGGWTEVEISAALAAETAADAGAQERRWRTALKRARHERRGQQRAPDRT